jgi:hypothetical protein
MLEARRVAGAPGRAPRRVRLTAVNAREKLLQRAPHWSEEQAERALRAAESDAAVDEWGDLSELHAVSSAETMRRLAKEEQAAGHSPGEARRGPLGSASGLAPTSGARADAR